MQSKAHIKTHPLHPILVGFPIAFYVGTLVFDLLATINDSLEYAAVGKYMHIAGIIGAVIAAVPGVIDYVSTVPPESSAKKRAAKHGLINTTVLVLFGVALYLKYFSTVSPYVIIGIEFIGVSLTMVAGWMGGTLVHRNQISVVNRYADSGKWNELYVKQEASPYEVAETDELKVNHMKLVHVKDKRIVVARTEEGWVAFDDHCSHKGGSLAGGTMICGTVHCPWHGSLFDVNTGQVKAGPATVRIGTYTIHVERGKVYLVM